MEPVTKENCFDASREMLGRTFTQVQRAAAEGGYLYFRFNGQIYKTSTGHIVDHPSPDAARGATGNS